mmetsp:Transcript_41734/g.108681  ORF Transcript_41734/g.108681 Transcript_41734/m.108681 type:complete len:288 (-) Transcript_41734:668-1531(-)
MQPLRLPEPQALSGAHTDLYRMCLEMYTSRRTKKRARWILTTSTIDGRTRSRKGDQICRVGCTRMLRYENFWTGKGIDGTSVAVRPLPEWQHALVARIAQARDANREKAHEHLPAAVASLVATELALRHVLRVAREVGSGAPQRRVARARAEGLESGHWVADDGLDGARCGAVEGPAGVDTGLEPHALVLQRSAQGVVIGFGAALQLQAVLYALDVHDPHLRPRLLWRELVRLSLKGQGLEQAAHPLELLAARGHLEQPPVSEALPTRRRPEPPQLLWREAEGALRL